MSDNKAWPVQSLRYLSNHSFKALQGLCHITETLMIFITRRERKNCSNSLEVFRYCNRKLAIVCLGKLSVEVFPL